MGFRRKFCMKSRRHQQIPPSMKIRRLPLCPCWFQVRKHRLCYFERRAEMMSRCFRRKCILTRWAASSFGPWWAWNPLVSLYRVRITIFCLKGKRNEERERIAIYGHSPNTIPSMSSLHPQRIGLCVSGNRVVVCAGWLNVKVKVDASGLASCISWAFSQKYIL